MKCVVVSSSTLAEHGLHLDAEYYIGTETAKKVVRAEAAVKAAVARLRNTRQRLAEVEARSRALTADGSILPITPMRNIP